MDKLFNFPKVRNSFKNLTHCRKSKCAVKTSTLSKLIERTTRLKCTQKRNSEKEHCRTKYFIKNQLKHYLKAVPDCMKIHCAKDTREFKTAYLSAARELLHDLEKVLVVIERSGVRAPTGILKMPMNLRRDYVRYSAMPRDKAKMYVERRIATTKEMIGLFMKF
jgi:hypothetical protein